MLQGAIVGQHDEPLAVAIESACGVNARDRYIVAQVRPAFIIRKLRQHVKGFIQQDDSAHPLLSLFLAAMLNLSISLLVVSEGYDLGRRYSDRDCDLHGRGENWNCIK